MRQLKRFMVGTTAATALFFPGSTNYNVTGTPTSEMTVAVMGDSIAAGAGAGRPENMGGCWRSLDQSIGDHLREYGVENVAELGCRGASISDIYTGQHGEPPQIESLSSDVDAVVLSVGANFVDLKDIFAACKAGDCGPDTSTFIDTFRIINSEQYRADLAGLYRDILDRINPDGILLINQYTTPIQPRGICPTIIDEHTDLFVASFIDAINRAISQAVEELDDPRIYIVKAVENVDACATLGWGVQRSGENIGHPTGMVYREMAKRIISKLQHSSNGERILPPMEAVDD